MSRASNRLPAARPRETFESLPVTLDLSPSRAVAVGRLLLAVAAFVFAYMIRAETGPSAPGADATVALIVDGVPLAFAAAGVLALATGLVAFLSRREARFDASSVRVTGRTPFGREEWQAPLSAFEGVAWRTVRRRRRRGPDRIFQVIELVHPDPDRTLPLYVRQSRSDARAEWEAIARALDRPAIDARGGDFHARAPEDLDKSVRELAAEGRARVSWQPGSEPPAGLSWESTGGAGAESLVVRLHARRLPFWLYVVVAGFGAFVLAVGVADREILAVLIGAGLIGGVAWYWLAEPGRPRELRITRDDIRLADPMPLGRSAGPLPLDGIEEIRVARPRGGLAAGTLVIASDRGEIRTGQGLSEEALAWLRDYLTAAVVAA